MKRTFTTTRSLMLSTLIGFGFMACENEPLEGIFDGELIVEDDPFAGKVLVKSLHITRDSTDFVLNFHYNDHAQVDLISTDGNVFDSYVYTDEMLERLVRLSNDSLHGSHKQFSYTGDFVTERTDYERIDGNDALRAHFEYHYDSLSRVSRIDAQHFGAEPASLRHELTFSAGGNCTERETIVFQGGAPSTITDYTYDSNPHAFRDFEPKIVLIDEYFSFANNPLTEKVYDEDTDELLENITHAYTYHANGFPATRNTTLGGELILSITYEYLDAGGNGNGEEE